MTKKLLAVFLLFFLAAASVSAQNKKITGKVVSSEDGLPLPGVSVRVKGSSAGNQTSDDGSFIINMPSGSQTLVFTYIGYSTQEVNIGSRSVINVKLVTDSKQLNEVVLVAYGSQLKKEMTGAQSTVKSSTFADAPLTNTEQALQGRAAGVQVTQSSGTPGGGMSVRIRGAGSITGSSQPLYVVDGIPISTGGTTQLAAGGQTTNSLSDINPDDIETMEILKDAASTALYGSRAANGVVLITTKRGKNQQTSINANFYTGFSQVYKKLPTLSGPEYINFLRDAITNRYGNLIGTATYPNYASFVANGLGYTGLTNDPSTYPTTNWQDQIFRSAPMSNYNLAIRGGSDKTQFSVSGEYLNQQGIVINSRFQRYNGRMNLDHSVNSRFKVGVSTSFSSSLSNRINNDNNIYGAVTGAILLGTHIPVYNADGTFARDPNTTVENPVAGATLTTFNANNTRLLANSYGEYKILDWLTAKTTFGIDYVTAKDLRYYPSNTNAGRGANGVGAEGQSQYVNFLNENTLAGNKVFGKHKIGGLIGFSVQTNRYQDLFASATGFPGNDIIRLSAGAVKTAATSSATSWGLLSYFSRLNYSFDGRYFLEGSLRVDGSSKFGINKQYGTFPGVSGAWRISQEEFLRDNRVISELKLRGSYGITGSEAIGNFTSLALVSPGSNYNGFPGLNPTQIGNPDLSWEKNKSSDLGLNIGLFKDRISIDVDAYRKLTYDLLQTRQLVASSGFTSVQKNLGSVENKGLEFAVTAVIFDKPNLRWNVGMNHSINKNKILKLEGTAYATGFASWVQEGQALGAFRGYKALGLFQTQAEINAAPIQARTASQFTSTSPGDIRFADLNGDGAITSADQDIIGYGLPTWYGGIFSDVKYKNFDLNVLFQYSGGNKIYNNNRSFGEGMNAVFGQLATTLDRWTPTNTNTTMPRAVFGDPNTNRRVSDRFLEDGKYLRFKNLTLGYSLGKAALSAIHVRSLRIYAAAQNLVTFTRYSGFDPEVSTFSDTNTSPSTDFGTYPQARTYTFGINLGL